MPVAISGFWLYLAGCNGTITGPKDKAVYQIAAACVIDHSMVWSTVVADLHRGTVRRPQAKIVFGADTLRFRSPRFNPDSAFSTRFESTRRYPVGSNQLLVADSSAILDTFHVSVTDSFRILQVVPTNRDVRGTPTVSLSWSGAQNSDGYAIATVLRDSAYLGTGYCAFVTSLNTNGTFPPDAFSLSPGPLPDTGWYYVYVYAYSGSPDSSLSRASLPVPFPHQLNDNLTGRQDISGHYGMIRVTAYDSVHVRF